MIDSDILYNERFDRLDKQIDKLDKQLDKLIELQQKTTEQDFRINNISNQIELIWKKLDLITSKPAKRWDNVITCFISTLISGIVAYVLVRLGLK